MDSGADSGPILRRSNVVLQKNDTSNMIFNRVVALGNELMIEVVKEIIGNEYIRIFKQPQNYGKTYLFKEFTSHHMLHLHRDLRNGWLEQAVREQKKI